MQTISRDLKRCGIYMIVNTYNNHRYIGSSSNIQLRLQRHRSCLRHGYHANQHLQNAWNKYGEGCFIYSILEFCDESIKIEREQFYVDTLFPEYNIAKEIVNLPSYSEESRLKHSKTRRDRIASGLIKRNHCTPVYVYDLQGEFVKKFDSELDACRELDIARSSIYKVLKGEQKRAGQYRFYREEQTDLGEYSKEKRVLPTLWKTIAVSNETEHYEFQNAEECSEFFNVSTVYIRNAIKNNRKFKRKYMIYYKSAVS